MPAPAPAPTPDLRAIPLDAIDPHALPRDRTCLAEAEMAELAASLRRSGLRQPVELFPLPDPDPAGPHLFGLVSGYRRLAAWRRLRDEREASLADALSPGSAHRRPPPSLANPYQVVPAFIRPAAEAADALAAVVEENEQRAPLSPYERGAVIARAVDAALFDTHQAAIRALHPGADRHKRARLLALAELAETLGPLLADPERLSQRQCLRLAAAIRMGFEPVMRAALNESEDEDAAAQWRKLDACMAEAESQDADAPAPRPDRPRRVLRPRKGISFRREMTRDGWCIHVTGHDATSDFCDAIFDEIEGIFDPGRRRG